jgi:hypothetical protein
MLPEGITHARHESDHAEGRPLERAVLSATSLQSLLDDYVFFTLLPLYQGSGIDYDPIQEFMNSEAVRLSGTQPVIVRLEFDEAIFDAPAPQETNVLMGCERSGWWPLLLRHLTSTALLNRTQKTFAKVAAWPTWIADQLAKEKRGYLPSPVADIPVTGFGVDASYGIVSLARDTTWAAERPGLVRRPALAETVAQAKAQLEM